MSRKAKRVMRALLGAPWSILPEKLDAIAELVTLRARGLRFSQEEIAARIGSKDQRAPATSPPRGIAVIPLYGVLAQRMNMMTDISGGTSTEKFGAWFDQAMADPAISAIILDCDSPGGEVAGIAELYAKIFGARGSKPIVAIANSMAASAAYWVACAADEVVCTPSGMVGSIGIITIHADTSEADLEEGVKYTVLSSGKYKAEGNSYEPLSAEGRAAIQSLLDTSYGQFVNAVAKGRGVAVSAVRSGFGQGRIVTADAALAAGMVDRIATLDDTVARLGKRRGGQALAIPERAATAIPLQPAAAATATLSALAPITITAGPDTGDVGPRIVPVLTPAPQAKDTHMTGPAVTAEPGAANPEVTRLTAELARRDGLDALKREHPEFAAKIEDWKISGQTTDFVRDQIRKDLQAKLTATPVVTGSGGSAALVPEEAKKPFTSFGEQLQAIHRVGANQAKPHDFARLSQINAAVSGASESISSDGGFAVQQDFIADILTPVYDNGEITSRVRRIPIGGNANGVRFNIVDETSRATGSRWGGIQFSFKAEGDQGASSKPKLRPFTLDLKKCMGLYFATDELLQDAPAMQTLLGLGFNTELQFFIEDQFFRGQGAGSPQGILTGPATVQQAIEAGQTIANTPASIVLNATKMKTHMPPGLYREAIWMANSELEPSLVSATLGGTAAAMPVYLQQGTLASPTNAMLLGRPLIYSDYCEAVGTPGDLVLVNWGEYATADKGGAQQASSIHLRFDFDETAFRITYRFDGSPLWKTSVTPYKGAAARTPFVLLAVRV